MSNRGTESHGSPEDSRVAREPDDLARGHVLRVFLFEGMEWQHEQEEWKNDRK